MDRVLIIDDDRMYCHMLAEMVRRAGYEPVTAYRLKRGLEIARSDAFDVVFLDVRMPDGNGLTMLPEFRQTQGRPEVIIVTGAGDPDGAELAIKSGAWDYIEKGASLNEITLPLVRVMQYRRDRTERSAPRQLKTEGIIGSSPGLTDCLETLDQAARSDASVLITGESGTGKELFARAIHANSRRADNKFVVIDCAALPANLVESELFGHEKGAFTGAEKAHEGLVRLAHQGTLFLDEVGELPLEIQSAFLRVLQERRFRSVGGRTEDQSDFRLVAATNRDLWGMVQEGAFRHDLLYRLQSFVIDLPRLRDCPSDIQPIAAYHADRFCRRDGLSAKNFSQDFIDALAAYPWPGNVRELVNTIERSLAAAHQEPTLYRKHLPAHLRIHLARASVRSKDDDGRRAAAEPAEPPRPAPARRLTLQEARAQAEKKYLRDLIAETGGDIQAACRVAGLSRSRLYDLLNKYDIRRRPPAGRA